MRRRLVVLLALLASLLMSAAPAMAADPTHYTGEQHVGAASFWTQPDRWEDAAPGVYYASGVSAFSQVDTTNGSAVRVDYACAFYEQWTVLDSGSSTFDGWFEGCAPYDVLTVNPQLTEARFVAAAIPACPAWDWETRACVGEQQGTFSVVMTLAGRGSLQVTASGSSYGTPAIDRTAYMNRYFWRDADSFTGTFTFNGTDSPARGHPGSATCRPSPLAA